MRTRWEEVPVDQAVKCPSGLCAAVLLIHSRSLRIRIGHARILVTFNNNVIRRY